MYISPATNTYPQSRHDDEDRGFKKSASSEIKEPAAEEKKLEKKRKKKDKKRKSEETDMHAQEDDITEQEKRKKKRLRREKKARLESERLASEEGTVNSVQVIEGQRVTVSEVSRKRERIKKDEETETQVGTAEKPRKKKRKEDIKVDLKTEHGDADTFVVSHSTEVAISDDEVDAYLEKHTITIDYGEDVSSGLRLKPIVSFSQLETRIPSGLHSAFASFKEPTPIQACTWSPLLASRDVVGIAETGSGKTLAFGIPAVSKLVQSRRSEETPESNKKSKKSMRNKSNVQVLAIAPTRELALQTHDTLYELGKPFGLTSVAVFGGVDKEPQRRALRDTNAAMVVGTPGRLLDLINEGVCDLSGVTFLILDEADRMLDRGFENDIRAIIGHTAPVERRQTLMFSATWPEAVRRLAASFQRNPVRVTVGSDDLTANSRVSQVVEVFDDVREKDFRLLRHMRELKVKKGDKASVDELRILVFVLYKKEAPRVEQLLSRQGFRVGGLHGDLSQNARMAALDDFKSGKTQVLVATDVAARGLDIANVGTVINYTFPLTIEDYIHRIGRTGRGGKTGKSITFFTGDKHERSLAGEYARVLREGGFDASALKKFPMTIKKKEHSVYGAFYRDDVSTNIAPTHMKF